MHLFIYVVNVCNSPAINETARSAVLTRLVLPLLPTLDGLTRLTRTLRLFTDLVNDSLTEFTYDADLAGLSYHLFAHSNGLFITVTGYNDKVSVLLKHVLENIKNLRISPGRFVAIQEEV